MSRIDAVKLVDMLQVNPVSSRDHAIGGKSQDDRKLDRPCFFTVSGFYAY
nr:hypothetical protein [Blastopirellula marina]